MILAGQIYWTAQCELNLTPSAEIIPAKALKKLKHDWDSYIKLLATLVRGAGQPPVQDEAAESKGASKASARDLVAAALPPVYIDGKGREKIIAMLTIEVPSSKLLGLISLTVRAC